ncbi:hypothetical protein EDB84DRAFT_1236693, partial [Lactarius hengduanensis]
PHWQGNVHSLANKAESSVKLAYVDESGALTERIITNGVFMFGRQIRFVVTGDTPVIVMCGRCHAIGHHTDSTACPLGTTGIRCARCGGSHHTDEHSAFCTNVHDKVGQCRCLFLCLNCKGQHGTRSAAC